jgi:hypothetical protein
MLCLCPARAPLLVLIRAPACCVLFGLCAQPASVAVQLEQREEEVRFLRATVQKQDERIRALEQRIKEKEASTLAAGRIDSTRAGGSWLQTRAGRRVRDTQTAHHALLIALVLLL